MTVKFEIRSSFLTNILKDKMAESRVEQSLQDMGVALGVQVLGGETTLDEVARELRATFTPEDAKVILEHARKKVAEQILDNSALVSEPE